MNYYYDITGCIKLLKSEGYGFILADDPTKVNGKDIFFHAAALQNEDIDFGDLKVGQKVHIGTVSVNGRGLQAVDVTLVRPNSRARSARN